MITIGEYTYGADSINVWFQDKANVKIGKFCSIASGVQILLAADHRTDWITTYPFGHINQSIFTKHFASGHPKTNGDVVIGNDVWIGHRATIMSGITIGDGAVIAANAHVVKNVDAYSIVGGNPAKHLKYRFNESIRNRLIEIQWWNFPKDEIDKMSHILCSSDINKLMDYLDLPKVDETI